jgi:hypothetical protein
MAFPALIHIDNPLFCNEIAKYELEKQNKKTEGRVGLSTPIFFV